MIYLYIISNFRYIGLPGANIYYIYIAEDYFYVNFCDYPEKTLLKYVIYNWIELRRVEFSYDFRHGRIGAN
mgnify:CR=1 FL=1|jgi:hypothetical protein